MGYDELMDKMKTLLRVAMEARFEGLLHVKKVEVQAYADGYMRALSDAGLVSREELLRAIAQERLRFLGETSIATPEPVAAVG